MKFRLGNSNRQLTGPIHDGICVRQGFTARAGRLLSVDVYFATYKRENPGSIVVELLDFRKRQIAKATADLARLQDNSYREFGIGALLVEGQQYELKMWTQACRSGCAPTMAWGKHTDGGNLFVGRNLIRNGELTVNFNYEDEEEELDPSGPEKLVEHSALLEGSIPGLVSVVVPNFKCAAYLPKCLASIAHQTYSCLEVIVVDDGSPDADAAEAVVNSFKSLIPSLSFVRMPKNGGAPSARNAGAALARGEYLFFCDADVELYSIALETLVRCLLEVPSVAFAYGGFIWGKARVLPTPFDVEKLKRGNYVTTMSMIRRVYFPGWDESLKRHQDWDLWLTVVDNGHSGVCCGQYLFETPVREGSISTDNNVPMMSSKAIVQHKHGII